MVSTIVGISREYWAILAIRAVLSSVFLLHGSQKVFGLFGGTGLQGFVDWLAPLGVPAWLAYCAAFGEILAGLMVGLGIATEVGALILASNMVVAIFLVHWSHGYFSQNNGFEYPLNLLILCVALMLSGPGIWYLWDPFSKQTYFV
jgi:putative oxidoreductase